MFAYDYIEIFKSDDFDLPAGIYITVHGLGFVNLTADLHLSHRSQPRNGHSRISDTDTLLHRFGHHRGIDFLFQGETAPGFGPQRNDGRRERKDQNDGDDDSARQRTVIPEGDINGASIADQRENRPDRYARHQDKFRHQKQ